MDIITLDFETHFSTGYSLTKLTTPEYVDDEKFFVQLCGIKINDNETIVYHENEIAPALAKIDWANATLVCHNTNFDGYILTQVYGHTPARYADTMAMSCGITPHDKHNLKFVAERLFPDDATKRKGEELVKAFNIKHLTGQVRSELSRYCKQDVDLTYAIYNKLLVKIPSQEMDIIDLTVRMFTEPMLQLDLERARKSLGDLRKDVTDKIKDSGLSREVLASNTKFTNWIKEKNISVPLKESPNTGKLIPALGQTDLGYQEMVRHNNSFLKVWEARAAVKSRLGETRTERFINNSNACAGKLPVSLKYYGAHTGRFSGQDKVNFQNLTRGSELRKCIIAPDGYVILAADSSNIEARTLAWVAGQRDLIDDFEDGIDVYAKLASDIYGYEINKTDHPTERFVGKVAVLGLGYGMSWKKFQSTLRSGSMGSSVVMSEDEARNVVYKYRKKNTQIGLFWQRLDKVIVEMTDPSGEMVLNDIMHVGYQHITLPNGLSLRYPNLYYNVSPDKPNCYMYNDYINLYGGKLAENICQALSRIIICDQMMLINRLLTQKGHGRVCLTVHDEIVAVVKEEHAEDVTDTVIDIMRTPPTWAKDLPLDAEADFAKEYSK